MSRMTVSELEMAPRPKLSGRSKVVTEVSFVRALGDADLALLASERGTQKPPALVNGLRERHHALARCLARGSTPADASAITGYSLSRISILEQDPSFKELMAHYAQVKDFAFADFHDRASAVALDGINIIADRLEEDPAAISTGQILEIVKSLADRTGNSPVTKSTNMNVNVDMTARLTAARARVQSLRAPPKDSGG
jgi:hypothetical protein